MCERQVPPRQHHPKGQQSSACKTKDQGCNQNHVTKVKTLEFKKSLKQPQHQTTSKLLTRVPKWPKMVSLKRNIESFKKVNKTHRQSEEIMPNISVDRNMSLKSYHNQLLASKLKRQV